MAFFESVQVESKRNFDSLIPRCGACGLSKTCFSPKIPLTGKGRKGILIINEAPNQDDDRRNQHISGSNSKLLRETLEKSGIDLDLDCWRIGSIICRPPEDREVDIKEIQHCRPNILKVIKEQKPRIIIPLGIEAVESVVAPLWRDNVDSINMWVGWQIPAHRYNAWVTPTHSIDTVESPQDQRELKVTRLWWQRHIAAAVALHGRPWQDGDIPNYQKQIKVEFDPDKAASWIDDKIRAGGAVSFDYETNRLKPDHPRAEIRCCSVCWRGKETIAYPWIGAAIDATRRLLVSALPKIGWNKKFEERWTRRILGVRVNNWSWCGMLSAHHLDSREGITGAKFQGLVRLGVQDWSAEIKPYLSAADAEGFNRIKEVDLRTLLVYCGVDSLVEYLVASIQKKEMLA